MTKDSSDHIVERFICALDHLGLTREPNTPCAGVEFDHETFQIVLAGIYGDYYEEL